MSPQEFPKPAGPPEKEFHPELFPEQMRLQVDLIRSWGLDHPELSGGDDDVSVAEAMPLWIESGMSAAFAEWVKNHSEREVYTKADLEEILAELNRIAEESMGQSI